MEECRRGRRNEEEDASNRGMFTCSTQVRCSGDYFLVEVSCSHSLHLEVLSSYMSRDEMNGELPSITIYSAYVFDWKEQLISFSF